MISNNKSRLPLRLLVIISLVVLILSTLIVPTVSAASIVVIPINLQGWSAANVRADATVAITATNARSGLGSLEFTTNTVTPGQDKADFQITWNPATFPTRTLANLDSLSYDFFRASSSTTTALLHPVMRVLWYFDNATPGNVADDKLGSLIWEGVYQNPSLNPVPTDIWISKNILKQRFWMFITGGGVVQNYTSTLADWLAGTVSGQPGDPTPPNFALPNSTTYVYGINVGVGSGWGATFQGFADNVVFGFNGQSDTYNFEPVAPSPSATPVNKTAAESSIPVTFPCDNLEAVSNRAMTAAGTTGNVRQGDIFGNVYCHIINQDNQFITNPAEIGNLSLLQMGRIIQAVDLYGLLPDGVPVVPFIKPIRLCLRGSGDFYFLNAANANRTIQTLPIILSSDNYTCVEVPMSGTVLLIDREQAALPVTSSASVSTALTDCQVRTTHLVRLRAEPNTASVVLTHVPFNLSLTATDRMADWFKVIFMDTQGWIHSSYLVATGGCGI